MIELLVYAAPTLIYLAIFHKELDAVERMGWEWPKARNWWQVVLIAVLGIGSTFIVLLMPEEILDTPGVLFGSFADARALLATLTLALGQELFFRGFVYGSLTRKFSFRVANLIQSGVAVVPHVLVLRHHLGLWPYLVLIFVTAWLLGVLRERIGSIWPGVLVNAGMSLAAGLVITLF